MICLLVSVHAISALVIGCYFYYDNIMRKLRETSDVLRLLLKISLRQFWDNLRIS